MWGQDSGLSTLALPHCLAPGREPALPRIPAGLSFSGILCLTQSDYACQPALGFPLSEAWLLRNQILKWDLH